MIKDSAGVDRSVIEKGAAMHVSVDNLLQTVLWNEGSGRTDRTEGQYQLINLRIKNTY